MTKKETHNNSLRRRISRRNNPKHTQRNIRHLLLLRAPLDLDIDVDQTLSIIGVSVIPQTSNDAALMNMNYSRGRPCTRR